MRPVNAVRENDRFTSIEMEDGRTFSIGDRVRIEEIGRTYSGDLAVGMILAITALDDDNYPFGFAIECTHEGGDCGGHGSRWATNVIHVTEEPPALLESDENAPQGNAEETEEPPAEPTYQPGEIVRVTRIYRDEDLTEGPFLAEYVKEIPPNGWSYYRHTVIRVRDGYRLNVTEIEKGPSLAEELQRLYTSERDAVHKASTLAAEMKKEYEAWKRAAAIKAMRVAIRNEMCSQTERAMHAADMPVTVMADVTVTFSIPMAVREYVKAIDAINPTPIDDDDRHSESLSRSFVDRAAYALAETFNAPAYKISEIMTSFDGIKLSETQREFTKEDNCKCGYCN